MAIENSIVFTLHNCDNIINKNNLQLGVIYMGYRNEALLRHCINKEEIEIEHKMGNLQT